MKQRTYLAVGLLLFATIFSFSHLTAKAQQLQTFSINGQFNLDTLKGRIYLHYPVDGNWVKDSCSINNGVFSFTGKIAHPVLGRLNYNNSTRDIFLEPEAMKVLFTDGQLEYMQVSGSASQIAFNEIDRRVRKINSRWQSVMDTLSAVNRRNNTDFQELKGWVLQPYFAEINEAYLGFFNNHPQSYVTAYFLSIDIIEMNQGHLSSDSLTFYYNKLGASVENSWYGKQIIQNLTNRKIAIPGTDAPDFTKTDLNGKPLSLSAFRGKYVLLDFWGSWCVPCRKANPHLKALYQRYKDKGFDIIGIAADNDTEDAWKKAIEADGLPWHHILIDDLDTKYNILSYPTKILVDPKGTIIERYDVEEKDLDEKLNSIFNTL